MRSFLYLLALLPLSLFAAIAPENLAVGDWVFRAGTGQESALIRYLDDGEYSHIGIVVAVSRLIQRLSGGAYSHIGIVVAVTPEIRIVHATTDDDPAHPNQVIASSFAAFTDPRLAGSIAAARPLFLDEAERAQLAAVVAAQIGQPFHLRARDQSPRYCTTIIYDALTALRPAIHARWRHIDLPLLQGDYLFPRALAELPGLEWL